MKVNKKNVFLWTLYDFANSISVIVFFLYFSQWLVIDNKVQDIWYNLLFVGSTILLLATAPVFGSISDKQGIRMPYLRVVTVLQFIFLIGASLASIFSAKIASGVILASVFFMIANYFYMFSFTYYNAFLNQLAPVRLRGFISGIGQSANWVGQIFGLLITLPLALGAFSLFNASVRAETFLPATLLFFLFSLPMLFFFKEENNGKKVKINIFFEYKDFFITFKKLLKVPGLGRYLLAFFFFNDAMITAINNFPIYLERVFKVSDATKSLLVIATLATSAIGALLVGFISDKYGLKKSLLAILIGWIIIFPTLAIISNFTIFTIATVGMGFLFGASWTVARAVMSYLTPQGKLNNAYSYYTLAERFSTFLGPLAWGLITFYFLELGDLRYRIALFSMAIFIFIGFIIAKKIPSDKIIVKK